MLLVQDAFMCLYEYQYNIASVIKAYYMGFYGSIYTSVIDLSAAGQLDDAIICLWVLYCHSKGGTIAHNTICLWY